jgi:glycine/D-amino acid oxidase-like deaminating enzyme/nitrite reductase/ring-hydroxylating ferredoxin subunit
VDTAQNELHSPWLAAPGPEPRPPLTEDLEVDAAVLGGGIVGISAAHQLSEAGLSVAVLEARTIASGVTGNSTAKLSALQGTIYSRIRDKHGDEAARAYAELNRSGVEEAFGIADRVGIECRLDRRPAYTHAERDENRGQIEEEVEAARAAGLDAAYTEETDLPYGVAAAVRLDDQGQFDPVAWCRGLAEATAARGAQLFEGTRATRVATGDRVRVETETGVQVGCKTLVVATHMPFLDRGLYFARLGPMRSYAVAGPVGTSPPRGMYLSVESPTRSIRSFTDLDGTDHVIVGGEGHKAGHSDPVEHYRNLERDMVGRHGAQSIDYRWAAHDLVPVDSLPYIGRLTPFNDRVLTATGFSKWGLAAGIAASGILRDLATGRDNPLAEAFDPARLNLRAALPELVKERGDDAFRFFFDRLKRRPAADPAPGEGLIAASGLEQHAVYRDHGGELHRLSARCTHLGCIVAWNPVEKSWDCPCHGSRFAATGEVLQGPAVDPLARKQ